MRFTSILAVLGAVAATASAEGSLLKIAKAKVAALKLQRAQPKRQDDNEPFIAPECGAAPTGESTDREDFDWADKNGNGSLSDQEV